MEGEFRNFKEHTTTVTEFSLSLPGRNVDVETVFTRKCLMDGSNKLVTSVTTK